MKKIILAIMVLIAVSTSLSAQKKRTVTEVMDSYIKQSEELVIRAVSVSTANGNITGLNIFTRDWDEEHKKQLAEALNKRNALKDSKNPKEIIQIRKEWNKMQEEAAKFLSNRKDLVTVIYKENVKFKGLTEQDYIDQTVSVTGDIEVVVTEKYDRLIKIIKNNLSLIPQKELWGEKINGFPWTYGESEGKDRWSIEYVLADKNGKTAEKRNISLKNISNIWGDLKIDVNEFDLESLKLKINSNSKFVTVMTFDESVKKYIEEKKYDLENGWKPNVYLYNSVSNGYWTLGKGGSIEKFCNELSRIYGLKPVYIYDSLENTVPFYRYKSKSGFQTLRFYVSGYDWYYDKYANGFYYERADDAYYDVYEEDTEEDYNDDEEEYTEEYEEYYGDYDYETIIEKNYENVYPDLRKVNFEIYKHTPGNKDPGKYHSDYEYFGAR